MKKKKAYYIIVKKQSESGDEIYLTEKMYGPSWSDDRQDAVLFSRKSSAENYAALNVHNYKIVRVEL